MIIKSMSRKTPSFAQLLVYLNRGRKENDDFYFSHNIYSQKPYIIIGEFQENYQTLKKQKNSNALYHEIISLKHQKDLTVEQQREILKDLAREYVNARAVNNLVYAVIHEQHNQIHCHFMISSNELYSKRNKRLSQKQFDELKERLREYAYEKYPALERLEKKKEKARTRSRSIDSEVHIKKRTGQQTEREKIRDRVSKVFAQSKTYDELISKLRLEKFELYQRGKTFGVKDLGTEKKYRLKVLELEKEFADLTSKFEVKKEKDSSTDKEAFRQRMQEARKTNDFTEDDEHTFTKK